MSPAHPHVLIVDDEPVILQILSAVFMGEPVRLSTAADGVAALAVIEGEGCDLLITDKNLPDTSGLELMRRAKVRDPLCEVILITGYASVETAVDALNQGAFDYLRKPLDDVFDVRRKAARALDRRRLGLENQRLILDLQRKNVELAEALAETKALSAEIIQSEKLAGIGTLAAGIAHEVSSPLFGVLGLAEAILEEDDLSLVRSHAAEIVEYSESIRAIVQGLTTYARAGDPDEEEASAGVREAVDDALRLVQRTTASSGVRFSVEVEPGLAACIRATELQQIFVNLLKNAVEAVVELRPEGGAVSVRAWADGAQVWAEVRDDGPGIPQARLRLIFDPFFSTKPPGKGTGLGLNVIYRIIAHNRGHIEAESAPGAGATFRLRLPRA
jgi:C4-dicarboxylate-specific signal transduction histidine kinase